MNNRRRKSLKNRAIFQLAKMGANLRNLQSKISQVQNLTCESTSRHTCAISQVQKPISQLRNQLVKIINLQKMGTNLRNPKSLISQVHYSTCENFRSYKSTSRNTCAISQIKNPISQLRINLQNGPSCESTYEKGVNLRIHSNLRKYQLSFKFLFKPLILLFFISHSHFKLRNSRFKLRSPKISENPLHSKPRSRGSKEDHSAHLRVPCGTRASPFQPWPRREESKSRLHQLAMPD